MTVLTAVDGERVPSRAVSVGQELADQFDDEHVVIHVMAQETFEEYQNVGTDKVPTSYPALGPGVSYTDQPDSSTRSQSSTDLSSYSIQDGEGDAASVARDVVDATIEGSTDVTIQGRVGEPVEEILSEAERRDARYLVVGGRKRSPAGKALFGSNTQSILLSADRPVMTVMSGD